MSRKMLRCMSNHYQLHHDDGKRSIVCGSLATHVVFFGSSKDDGGGTDLPICTLHKPMYESSRIVSLTEGERDTEIELNIWDGITNNGKVSVIFPEDVTVSDASDS